VAYYFHEVEPEVKEAGKVAHTYCSACKHKGVFLESPICLECNMRSKFEPKEDANMLKVNRKEPDRVGIVKKVLNEGLMSKIKPGDSVSNICCQQVLEALDEAKGEVESINYYDLTITTQNDAFKFSFRSSLSKMDVYMSFDNARELFKAGLEMAGGQS
jgi:hypothetical protein